LPDLFPSLYMVFLDKMGRQWLLDMRLLYDSSMVVGFEHHGSKLQKPRGI
jgi:hypothetical protein